MEQANQTAHLYQHGEKLLAAPVKKGLFACCPTMDLVATVCHDAQVDVYRLNGQRAFGLSPSNSSSAITALCWKYNGTALAVGWDDGSIDVISAETGKVLQHIANTHVDVPGATRDSVTSVATLGWGVNFINPDGVRAQVKSTGDSGILDRKGFTLDDMLARLPEPRVLDLDPDLPDQLAALDLESQLPRIPALAPLPASMGRPAAVFASEAFTSQNSLDALLHPRRAVDLNTTDVLLCIEADSVTLPVLYGSLALRPLRRPAGLAAVLPLRHAYSPFATSHMVLAETELPSVSGGGHHLALLPLTLPFTKAASRHTQTISSKAAKVQTLLSYISACLDSIAYHWRQSQDLPAKFMRVIGDTLDENEEMSLVPSLYHLAATGHCMPSIKEWLTEQLMERGHKRWDHAVKLGYAKIVEITHESLLPAIDRCTLLVSNLRGLAAYYQDTGIFDIPSRRMTVTIEALQCLRMLSHHVLHFAGVERKQFSAFSKWLRHEIDAQGANQPTSDDAPEQDPGIDYTQVLSYIKGALAESKLRPFVSEVLDGLPEIPSEDMTHALISKHVDALRSGGDYRAYAVSMRAHFGALKSNASQLFDLVVEWQLTNSAYHMAILLDEADAKCSDIRMAADECDGTAGSTATYVVVVPRHADNEVHLYRILHSDMVVGGKCIHQSAGRILSFRDQHVRDIQFADDQQLMAIVDSQDGQFLVSVPYRGDGIDYDTLQGSIIKSTDRHAEIVRLNQPADHGDARPAGLETSEANQSLQHKFNANAPFKAGTLEVNGRKDRRLIYVLSQDGRHYQVLDMDNPDPSGSMVPEPQPIDVAMDTSGT